MFAKLQNVWGFLNIFSCPGLNFSSCGGTLHYGFLGKANNKIYYFIFLLKHHGGADCFLNNELNEH